MSERNLMRGLQIHPVGSPRGSGRLDIHPRNRFPPLSPLPSPPSPSRLSPHAPPLNPPIRPPPAVSPLSCPLPLLHQHVTPSPPPSVPAFMTQLGASRPLSLTAPKQGSSAPLHLSPLPPSSPFSSPLAPFPPLPPPPLVVRRGGAER